MHCCCLFFFFVCFFKKIARQIANNGCAVVCTIHQPSAEVFETFDYLLLLQVGIL